MASAREHLEHLQGVLRISGFAEDGSTDCDRGVGDQNRCQCELSALMTLLRRFKLCLDDALDIFCGVFARQWTLQGFDIFGNVGLVIMHQQFGLDADACEQFAAPRTLRGQPDKAKGWGRWHDRSFSVIGVAGKDRARSEQLFGEYNLHQRMRQGQTGEANLLMAL